MGVVWSTPALRIFRQWFEQEARSRRIINTSRRGARIAGTHEIPLEALRLEAQETSPGEALAAASALAPTMRRETMIEALREERLVAERHYARALTAYESSQRCWQDLTAMHGVGGGSLSASYAIPSLEEVAIVHPRQGVQALAAIAERIVDRGPILIQHLDQAIAALGGSDA
jgi:hypothetical protein